MTGAAAGAEALAGDGGDGAPLSVAARGVARGLRRQALAPSSVALAAALVDLATVALALVAADFVAGDARSLPVRGVWAAAGGLAAAGIVAALGGYRLAALRRPAALVAPVAAGMAAALAGATAAAAGTALLALMAGCVPARALMRMMAGWALDFGLTERRAVIVGGGADAARLIEGLAANPDNDIRVCGIFDDRDDARSPAVVDGVPKLGTTRALLRFAREAEIDLAIVALPLSADRRIREIMATLGVLPIDVRLSVYSADMAFRRRPGRAAPGGLVALMTRPLRGGDRLVKRTLDVIGAAALLVALAPVMAAVAAAIRLEGPGPVLFRQPRHGYNYRPVEVWKFRSMRTEDCDPAAARVVTRGDPRVTRVGRVIRKYSLDELPQLFNVLRGDLSLVGPRPHAVNALSSRQEAFAAIVEGYAARHKVRPGLTGWAQIHGWRGEIDDPEKLRRRFEHDLYYIENWSVWLDLKVLALTPFRLLDTRNAY